VAEFILHSPLKPYRVGKPLFQAAGGVGGVVSSPFFKNASRIDVVDSKGELLEEWIF
jgi:hypothetical protein